MNISFPSDFDAEFIIIEREFIEKFRCFSEFAFFCFVEGYMFFKTNIITSGFEIDKIDAIEFIKFI